MTKKKTDKDTTDTEKKITPGPDIPENMHSIDRLPVTIHAQYIKDLSFENPNAPMPLTKSDGKPAIGVDFSMDARKVEVKDFENAYEVALYVSVNAKKGDITTFLLELEYGMMVTLENVPEDKVHPLLLIEMPNYLFPYARQIVSDMTQAAGYMPFLLSPVNFKALYRKRFGGPKAGNPGDTPAKDKKEKESA